MFYNPTESKKGSRESLNDVLKSQKFSPPLQQLKPWNNIWNSTESQMNIDKLKWLPKEKPDDRRIMF